MPLLTLSYRGVTRTVDTSPYKGKCDEVRTFVSNLFNLPKGDGRVLVHHVDSGTVYSLWEETAEGKYMIISSEEVEVILAQRRDAAKPARRGELCASLSVCTAA